MDRSSPNLEHSFVLALPTRTDIILVKVGVTPVTRPVENFAYSCLYLLSREGRGYKFAISPMVPRDGWPGSVSLCVLVKYEACLPAVTHISIQPRHRVTSLLCTTTLPTATYREGLVIKLQHYIVRHIVCYCAVQSRITQFVTWLDLGRHYKSVRTGMNTDNITHDTPTTAFYRQTTVCTWVDVRGRNQQPIPGGQSNLVVRL